jgi:UDP-N-acetylglucosamine 1-carboxyvinyltransferase
MGADIKGAGTNVISIDGVERLKAIEYTPMPDRLEVGTFLVMAAATGGQLTVEQARADHLEIVLSKLSEMGCSITAGEDTIKIESDGRLQAADFLTYPYPGFPTDLQPCFVALACRSNGTSHMRETIFDDRFNHCMELMRLGARISVNGDLASIDGVDELLGATVMASDIRAGAGLVTAALAANGTSTIRRIYHIERGYESLPEKLRQIGASIDKIPEG